MAQTDLSLGVDEPLDDLPRTFRREREARDRAAQAAAESQSAQHAQSAYPTGRHWDGGSAGPAVPAVVTALDIPFFRLVMFFIKAVFAAIPALILLGAMLWLAGDLLTTYFPWLVKVKVLIHVPPL